MRLSTILLPAASLAIIGAAVSCDNSKSERQQAMTDSIAQARNLQLEGTIAERDSLLALFNDVAVDMIQIKEMESIVSLPSGGAADGRTATGVRDDIRAIRQSLAERRQRLEELEKQLSQQSGKNTQLLAMVANLKEQISQNEATISSLTAQLQDANVKIEGLNQQVDSLGTSLVATTTERDEAVQKGVELANEMNRCYYCIGSNKELKEHRIIEKQFLRKTKIMQGDFETSYFTQGDKRTLSSIPVYAKKAKVLTNQPADSYEFTEDNMGQKVLNITNPGRFWGAGNYLVIETN